MIRKFGLAILLVIGLITQGCGKENHPTKKSPKSKPALYLDWHNKCLDGKTKDIDAQIDNFEAQIKADHDDNLARVYLGSACALRAKESFWGPTKLKYLNRGNELMDAAVKNAPDNPRIRMVRAIGYYKMPKRFGKRPTAVADFEKLLAVAEIKPSSLQTNEWQVVLYFASCAFKEESHKDANKAKKLCHQLAPTSKYGKLTAE